MAGLPGPEKKVDDFSECCPLLELMADRAMMTRHWKRITELTGHPFEVEPDNFKLLNIMQAPLLQYKDQIEVRVHSRSSTTIIKYRGVQTFCREDQL